MLTERNNHQEFAERIRAATLDLKGRAEHGQCFILPWRMDANQDLRQAKGLDECGCGISQDDPPPG
jgi:hypothetical protein